MVDRVATPFGTNCTSLQRKGGVRSQAVRLPTAFRFDGTTEVFIEWGMGSQGRKLFLGLRGEDKAIAHRAFACSTARRARNWSTVTARDGSAFRAS